MHRVGVGRWRCIFNAPYEVVFALFVIPDDAKRRAGSQGL
jgi:hypothetical protein